MVYCWHAGTTWLYWFIKEHFFRFFIMATGFVSSLLNRESIESTR